MARVEVTQKRDQSSSFGLYRTSAGGDESIIVRRKVGDPTDTNHTKSRKLMKQRANLTLASQDYSKLTPSQKAITRHQMEEVEYIKSHGKTDTKLLIGRQLFISKEMHSLETTQTQLVLPYELCISLVDEFLNPLDGELWLRYFKSDEWKDIGKEQLATGNWLFSQTPRAQEAYRPYGEAQNYYDPELPELQFMTEAEILLYRYHVLESALATICHTIATGLSSIDMIQGSKHTSPFIPCYDFTLKEMLFSLRRHADPERPPPSSGFVSVHEEIFPWLPKEPPLAKDSFSVSLPAYPTWHTHKVTFPSIDLEGDKNYVWIIGFPGEMDIYRRVLVERGEDGSCNLDPITHAYLSYYRYGIWQPWFNFTGYQHHYEMKA